jgi:hypothetical protein
MLQVVERTLGYKLPKGYVDFMRLQNGGIPKRANHRTSTPTSWTKECVAITGIYGIDASKKSSLGGCFGSQFWIGEWGYPNRVL